MTKLKTVFIDVETAPNLSWIWGMYEQNALDTKTDWYVMSYAYKWAQESETRVVALPDFPGYKRHPESDKALIKSLWKIENQADVVIAHNGDGFDIPKINTRFLVHGLKPPTPFKTVDTLKIARKNFSFSSNKLDDLSRYLGLGRKLPNSGFHLWKSCMAGDLEAWEKMREYNKHDVELLEKVYYLLRPWDKRHPVMNLGESETCPKCSSTNVQKRGFNFTLMSKAQRFQCGDCASWFQGGYRRVK